jgi:hypothetical protein
VSPENPFQPQADPDKVQSADVANQPAEERPQGPSAWQPFTPKGIAAFAFAAGGRLFLVQAAMAFISAFTMVWFVWFGWIPEIKEAIRSLPPEGIIENQQLKAQIDSTKPLADHRGLLGIAADPENKGGAALRSDLKVQLRKDHYEICFLLGCKTIPYPRGEIIQFNQLELKPRWEAWEPFLLAAIGLSAWLFVFVSWIALALLYFPLVCLIAYFRKRQLSLSGSWRISGAALMPGAALLSIGIVCYGLGIIDLIRLFTLVILHVTIGWVYLGLAITALPLKTHPQSPANPFSPAEAAKTAAGSPPIESPAAPPHPEEKAGTQLDNPS